MINIQFTCQINTPIERRTATQFRVQIKERSSFITIYHDQEKHKWTKGVCIYLVLSFVDT